MDMEYTDLFTRVEIPEAKRKLLPADLPLMLGSCFTDNIGERFIRCGWDACVNPCGVLYNPASMADVIRQALAPEPDLCMAAYDGRWFSWLMSGKFSSEDLTEAQQLIRQALAVLGQRIRKTKVVIITAGTVWCYYLKSDDRVVGNCHKVHPQTFYRNRLTYDETCDSLVRIISIIRHENPDVRFIFTVSPIRHFKDGAAENTLSKATLHCAVHQLAEEVEGVEYFPAYEIMMDELRDYRFYAPDRLHPSDVAVDYIWERFCDTYISGKDREQMRMAEKEWRRSQHRPIMVMASRNPG